MKRSESKSKFLTAAYAITAGSREISRPQVVEAAKVAGLPVPAWFVNDPSYRVSWGKYRLPAARGLGAVAEVKVKPVAVVESAVRTVSFAPTASLAGVDVPVAA